MSHSIRILSTISLFLLAAIQIQAQVQTGTPPFGSFSGSPDVINLGNLNVHWDIPFLHKQGRGTNFTYDLSYDASVWYPVGSTGSQSWTPVFNWGWTAATQMATGYISHGSNVLRHCSQGGEEIETDNWVYHDAFATPHAFNGFTEYVSGNCGGVTSPKPTFTSISDGYTITVNDAADTLYDVTGRLITAPINYGAGVAGSFTDRNGNQITANSSGQFFDTLSATVPVLTVTGSGTPTSPMVFSYTPPSGTANCPATQSTMACFTINYTNYTVATNFGVSGISEYKSTAAVPLITSVVQPDGSAYTFTYEPTPGTCSPYSGTTCVTARLIKVTLPTGGFITYNYTGGNNGIFSDGSTATLTRATPDGTWSYAQVKNTGAASTTTVTDPQNNITTIHFQGIYETQRVVNQGSATVLLTTNTCYNSAASPCTGTAITLPILNVTMISSVPTTGSGTLVSENDAYYNSYGMPTYLHGSAFGSGTVGGLLRTTAFTYASLGNINAFRQQVTVQNGAGTTLSQTNYNYDETTPVAPPTGTPPQWTSVSGSRGNLTSVQRCTNTSSCSTNYIQTATMNYDTAGQLQTVTDGNGNSTSFSYTDNFFTDNNPTPPAPKPFTSSVPTDASLCANIRETVLVLLINEQGEKEKGRDEREFSWCGSFPWGFG